MLFFLPLWQKGEHLCSSMSAGRHNASFVTALSQGAVTVFATLGVGHPYSLFGSIWFVSLVSLAQLGKEWMGHGGDRTAISVAAGFHPHPPRSPIAADQRRSICEPVSSPCGTSHPESASVCRVLGPGLPATIRSFRDDCWWMWCRCTVFPGHF